MARKHAGVRTTVNLRMGLLRSLVEPLSVALDLDAFARGRPMTRIPVMKQERFGKTDLRVSRIAFGSAPAGYMKMGAKRMGEILHPLLDAGVNVIDTAACYPDAEVMIGETVSGRRDEFVIVSKCGHCVVKGEGEEWSPALIRASIERSLRRLKTDRVDVMLLHSCKLEVLERGEAWRALQDAQRAGLVRFIGYSGDNEEAAFAAGLDGIAVLEVSINIADQCNIDLVLPEARRQDLGVLSKRPIADAAWKSPQEQHRVFTEYAAEYHDRLKKMRIDPSSLGVDGPPREAWVELALRFTLWQPGAPVAIIGTTNPEHALANLAVAEKGPLPEGTVRRIRDAFAQADPEGKWRGET